MPMARKTKKRQPTKLLQHKHTGKLRQHRHTHYGALTLVLLVALTPVLSISHSASADTSGGGAVQLNAVVTAPVPQTAPVITQPTNGQIFRSSDPITVQGSCPANTLIKVFKNNVMGGATLCNKGAFKLSMDLFIGTNTLIARPYNANDVAGPDSAPVSVKFLPPGVSLQSTEELNALGVPANAFYITASVFYRGAEAGSQMDWPLTISGGQAPYAINIGWDDGKTDLLSQAAAGSFTAHHTYAHAASNGSYTIVIHATDANGQTTYLQMVAIVSGNPATAGLSKIVGGGYSSSGIIRLALQLFLIADIVVLAFWLGERREASIFKRRMRTS